MTPPPSHLPVEHNSCATKSSRSGETALKRLDSPCGMQRIDFIGHGAVATPVKTSWKRSSSHGHSITFGIPKMEINCVRALTTDLVLMTCKG